MVYRFCKPYGLELGIVRCGEVAGKAVISGEGETKFSKKVRVRWFGGRKNPSFQEKTRVRGGREQDLYRAHYSFA